MYTSKNVLSKLCYTTNDKGIYSNVNIISQSQIDRQILTYLQSYL